MLVLDVGVGGGGGVLGLQPGNFSNKAQSSCGGEAIPDITDL